MRRFLLVLAAALVGRAAPAPAAELLPLRVLYVGAAKSARAGHFETFLKGQFRAVRVANRDDFQPADANDADVVLLDWSQDESRLEKTAVPLGKPEDWHKPTVLLNHAGLLVAARWGLIGGAG